MLAGRPMNRGVWLGQVPLLTGPQASLGETFEEELKARLAPIQEALRPPIITFVKEKQEEIKRTVIYAALIGGGLGLVTGILVAPVVRGLLGMKK